MDLNPAPNWQNLNATDLLKPYGHSLLPSDDDTHVLQMIYNSSIGNRTNRTFADEFSITFSDPIFVLKAVGLGLMIILTIFGNMLVIVSVLPSPTLRTPTHSLIVNLAVADLLLGTTVLPISAARELADGMWIMGTYICSIWTTLDVLCCTASILSLCGISVDRYIGVSRPLSYSRIVTKRRVRYLIAGIWTLAGAISIAQPLGWKEEANEDSKSSEQIDECGVNKNLGYVIFSVCGSFYLPTLVILILYTLVYRAAVKHSNFIESGMRTTRSHVTLRVHLGSNNQKKACFRESICDNHVFQKTKPFASSPTYLLPSNKIEKVGNGWGNDGNRPVTVAGFYGRAAKFRRQKKAAKTLGIVVGCFLLCWFPFFLVLPLDAACSSCHLPGALFNFAFWLGYFNSCLNPFIYACTSRELRRAFLHILCCWRKKVPMKTKNFSSKNFVK